jgi:tripeptide aminopeptidase
MEKFNKNKILEKLFVELVKIDSPSGNEKEVGLYIVTWLKYLGLKYKTDAKGNIYSKTNNKYKPVMLLCAHMDTVQPGENIKPVIKNGIVSSSGNTILGADNKSSIAVIMKSVEEQLNYKNCPSIELLFTVEEEVGFGLNEFPIEWIESNNCLIIDSSNPLGGIVIESPYVENFKIVLSGKSAHISKLKDSNSVLPTILNSIAKLPTGAITKNTTINFGQINIGHGANIVPGTSTIIGEVRSFKKAEFNLYLKKIKDEFIKEANKNKVRIEFCTSGYCSGYSHNKKDEFIQDISYINKQLGLETKFIKSYGASDANFLNAKGINAINISSGVVGPHSLDESVAVKDLYSLKDFVIKLIKK